MTTRFSDDSDNAVPMPRFISMAKKMLWNASAREELERFGVSLNPARFYNDIPTIEEARNGYEAMEETPYLMNFFDESVQVNTISTMATYAHEFDPAQDPSDDGVHFGWKNGMFSNVDAMAYYCMLRHIKPRLVLEVGSGHSTRVAAQALEENGGGEIVSIEPFPSDELMRLQITLHKGFVQNFDAEFFNDQLKDGDVFFIDSTHTVKASSDCCHLYLRILPNLRRNVTVHVHDIRLPRGLDVSGIVDRHVCWAEQHLLAALLCDNPKVEFLFGSVFGNLRHHDLLQSLMGGKAGTGGASFWFRWNGNRDQIKDP